MTFATRSRRMPVLEVSARGSSKADIKRSPIFLNLHFKNYAILIEFLAKLRILFRNKNKQFYTVDTLRQLIALIVYNYIARNLQSPHTLINWCFACFRDT